MARRSPWITLFAGTSGLNTKSDPVRIGFDGDTGVRALARAVNVLTENDGRLSRRKGSTRVSTGNYRSAWNDGGVPLCVKDNYLCLIQDDLSIKQLRAVTTGARMSYCWYWDRIYYSNGYEQGYVSGGEDHDWDPETWPGPDTDRQLTGPPMGHLLTELNGRIYIAAENAVYCSERGYPGVFWLEGRYHLYPSRIKFLKACTDGVWVGDGHGIYWIEGVDPEEQTERRVADYPVIEGTDLYVHSDELGYEGLIGSGLAIKVLTTKGIATLGRAGFYHNETLHTIEHDKAPRPFTGQYGAAAIINGCYVATIEP